MTPTTIMLGNVREAVWVAIHGSLCMTAVQVTETCGAVMEALDNLHLLDGIPEGDAESV